MDGAKKRPTKNLSRRPKSSPVFISKKPPLVFKRGFKPVKEIKLMDLNAMYYFLFGLSLVVIFIGIIFYYYSKKRKSKVEEPKYRMLEDD